MFVKRCVKLGGSTKDLRAQLFGGEGVAKGHDYDDVSGACQGLKGHNKVRCVVFSLLGALTLRSNKAAESARWLGRRRHPCLVGLTGSTFGDTSG